MISIKMKKIMFVMLIAIGVGLIPVGLYLSTILESSTNVSGFTDLDGKPVPFIDYVESPAYIRLHASALGKSNVIQLIDNSTTARQEIRHSIDTKTNGTIEFWIRTSSITADTYFRFYDQYNTMAFQVYFIREVGLLWIKHGNHGNSAYTYSWYHCKIEFEYTDGEYKGLEKNRMNFYVNGYQKLTSYPLYGFSISGFRVLTSISQTSSAYLAGFRIIE